MAGNKVNTKSKGKEDKNKANKQGLNQTNDDSEDTDFALLRKPILTSITGFNQARKIFDLATEELKSLLSEECDILYECKVCRNIFRSLANFISHKRVYCIDKFNSSVHGHFIKSPSTFDEIMKIKRIETSFQNTIKGNEENIDTDDERIPITKDLTAIIESITKKKSKEYNPEEANVLLHKIPNSSVAVFQNLDMKEDSASDNMQVQVKELDKMLSKNVAILQDDGKFTIQRNTSTNGESVIQISDDDDNDTKNILKCKLCDLQFSTQKTLKYHMKYKHVESRLVYPCPDCLDIFSTSWSVYRHLFKVHRKTAAQIRRLRESIQSKAFKMNNPPAFYEKRKNNMKTVTEQKITEEERIDQENQAWMEHMEGEAAGPRCGGCGRGFERRAALAAHAHTCPPRRRRPPDAKKIEIQIRKDYNKGPPPLALPSHTNGTKQTSDTLIKSHKEDNKNSEEQINNEDEIPMEVSQVDQKATETIEPLSPDKSELENKISTDSYILTTKLPFAQNAEKSNLVALKQRIILDMELEKRLCKKCNIQCPNVQELYDHVASHYKWMRYACKLCNFKHYYFDKLPEHVKVVHKLKGDNDFYYSTVKAINGVEALELSEVNEELNEANEKSPDSRRPSRCSSDSSRLSDDSSSSSTRVEAGSRKRKILQNKNHLKKKKESLLKVGEDIEDATKDTSSDLRGFEENSSDMEEPEEKITKKQLIEIHSSVASRRPVRRKAKPKCADFEYDLSNLLKMEAQGYRGSLPIVSNKPNQPKKKTQQEIAQYYDSLNKDCCGALINLSKNAVLKATAHMKTLNFTLCNTQKEARSSNIFVRPMVPKILSKNEKNSPKKDSPEKKVGSCLENNSNDDKNINEQIENDTEKSSVVNHGIDKEKEDTIIENKNQSNPDIITGPVTKPLPIVPIKFRRQSMEVIKNPIINKNLTDLAKAGMKTKILVIKPINRKKDGTQTVSTPLKFQTIKLKDPNKNSLNETRASDQVVVVKVPKVDCPIARPYVCEQETSDVSAINDSKSLHPEVSKDVQIINSEKQAPNTDSLEDSHQTSKENDNSNNDIQEPNECVNGEIIDSEINKSNDNMSNLHKIQGDSEQSENDKEPDTPVLPNAI